MKDYTVKLTLIIGCYEKTAIHHLRAENEEAAGIQALRDESHNDSDREYNGTDDWWDDDMIYRVFDIQEVIKPNTAEVAMNLHYLAEEILSSLHDRCIGVLFGIGEDDFIMELYPYAEMIVKMTDEAHANGKNFRFVFVYEAMENLAEFFWSAVKRQNAPQFECKMPEMDEFVLDIQRTIDNRIC